MTASKHNSPAAEGFADLVLAIIAEKPFTFESHEWAALSQESWSKVTGLSPATIRRIISKPPFVRERTHKDGRVITLLRIGERGPDTSRRIANKMASLYRKRFGFRPGDSQFGCLVGLAEKWPQGKQVEIFKELLADWAGFLGVAKYALEVAEDTGAIEEFKNYKFNHLPISLVRIDCVAKAAVEFYIMQRQAKQSSSKKASVQLSALAKA